MAQIEVIEGLSLPGSPERENDDALGATHSIAFVLDGVTSLVEQPLLPGRSDAAWASRTARDFLLEQNEPLQGRLQDMLNRAGLHLAARFESERQREPQARFELPWTTLSMIRVIEQRIEIGFLGDSRILIETEDDEVHNFGLNPSRSAFETNLAEKMFAARNEKILGVDAIKATVLPELKRAREFVNTSKGFWLLGTDGEAGTHAVVTALELKGPATVLLMTDGFYALKEDYRRYGDRELIATAQTIGLKTLARELRHIEEDDPHGVRYRRMKKSDDATALLLRVEI